MRLRCFREREHAIDQTLKPYNASCRTHESSLSTERKKSCMLNSRAESSSRVSLQTGRAIRGSVLSSY